MNTKELLNTLEQAQQYETNIALKMLLLMVIAKFQSLQTHVESINEYLAVGGLFNPELMEHKKVRDMLINIRDAL